MSNGTLNISQIPPEDDGGSLTVGALDLSGGALTINNNGQLNLNGTLTQTGGTLTLQGGTISGGTINSTGGTLAFTDYGGTLSGVTFDGPLTVTGYLSSVNLANGTTVVGSSGSGPGTINVGGKSRWRAARAFIFTGRRRQRGLARSRIPAARSISWGP